MLGRHPVHISGSPKRRNKEIFEFQDKHLQSSKQKVHSETRLEFASSLFLNAESLETALTAQKKLDNTFVSMNRDKKKSDVIWFARLRLSSTRKFDLLHEVDSFKNNALAYVKMTDNDLVARKTMNPLGRSKITVRLTNCLTEIATKCWTSRMCYWHS